MSKEFTENYFKPCVKDFVSTVLLIDDQLEYQEPLPIEKSLDSPVPGKSYSSNSENSTSFTDRNDIKRKVYVTDLIKSFSKEGLLVTPINPNKLDSLNGDECINTLLKLSEKADVIILDWDMTVSFSSAENKLSSSELAQKIIEKLNEDNKYRLVIIYTAENEGDVKNLLPELSNIDVKIYGKTGVTGKVEKTYEELAEQIPEDYLSSKNGFLSLLLVKALTQLRYSTYSMLETLKADFDKSVLCHHLLLCSIPDFQDFCEGLIHDEIFGYLEQSDISDLPTNDLIKKIIEEKKISYCSEDTEIKETSDLLSYIDSVDNENEKSAKNGMKKFLLKKLSTADINKLKEFSAFVSCLDKNFAPNLRLGCVVEKADDYYLCVQPACDSVRIPTKTAIETETLEETGKEKKCCPKSFVFLKLEEASDNVDFYVQNETDFTGFSILYNQVENYYFSGDDNGFVSQNNSGDFITYSPDGNSIALKYICCLKPMFAQKIANNFAANISRVGIDQFEWLRLKGRD